MITLDEKTQKLKSLWLSAVEKYNAGTRNAANFFSEEEIGFLNSIGMSAQELYDFAEDYASYGEPSFETMALIQGVREDYFKTVMKGEASSERLDGSSLPPKTASIGGITWLPRIIPKAVAKLRGEMPDELMYCCGGDRNFFRQNNLCPAEFLKAVWIHEADEKKLIEYVKTCQGGESHGILAAIKGFFKK